MDGRIRRRRTEVLLQWPRWGLGAEEGGGNGGMSLVWESRDREYSFVKAEEKVALVSWLATFPPSLSLFGKLYGSGHTGRWSLMDGFLYGEARCARSLTSCVFRPRKEQGVLGPFGGILDCIARPIKT